MLDSVLDGENGIKVVVSGADDDEKVAAETVCEMMVEVVGGSCEVVGGLDSGVLRGGGATVLEVVGVVDTGPSGNKGPVGIMVVK